MSIDEKAVGWRPWYRMIQWSALLVLFLLLLAGFLLGRFQPPMSQLAFCAFGVLTGAAFARMSHPLDGRLTRMGCVALGFVAASQVFFQLLVWSETWRVHPKLFSWRLWWVTVVAAVGLGWLQVLWRSGARWEWKSGRTTLGFTAGLGLLLGSLAFRQNPLATLPGWWHGLALVMSIGALGGSAVIIGRWLKSRPKSGRPLPKWMRPALIVSGLAALSAGSFYIGRLTIPPPSPFDLMPSALRAMAPEQLEQQLAEDQQTLQILAQGMDELRAEVASLHETTARELQKEPREMYTPEESRKIRSLFAEYLSHREGLIRMAALYSGYAAVQDERLRNRAYLLGYTAAAVALEAGRDFVAKYRDNEIARNKLNQGEKGWLDPGMFDRVYHSVTSHKHLRLFDEHGRLFKEHRQAWGQDEFYQQAHFEWMAKRIERGQQAVNSIHLDSTRAWFSRIGRTLERRAYQPVYEAQELVATFVGDTRIVRRAPFISVDLVRETLKDNQLKPGDIILERRNWYLSNAFLPGFWPHTALYVGTPDQLMALGLTPDSAETPRARQAWEDHAKLDHGHPRVILEAVSEGVVFASAEHSLHADYVVVLRPRLTDEQQKVALTRAFEYAGLPYDFNFDFTDDDKLVCSELIYNVYHDSLGLKLEDVMGKQVLTPLGIMRKFANEHGKDDAQLKFVFFLDKPSRESEAREVDVETCRESVNRPKVFNE